MTTQTTPLSPFDKFCAQVTNGQNSRSDFEEIIYILKSRDVPFAIMNWDNGPVLDLGNGIYADFNCDKQIEGFRHEE